MPTIDVLLSYAFHSQTPLAPVQAAVAKTGGMVMVDSGAYTAWNKGTPMTVKGYARWLEQGGWDWAVTLDVIGDWEGSNANTRILHSMGIPVLPVYHYGSPWGEFLAMCKENRYVCAGGMGPLARRKVAQRNYLARLARVGAEHGTVIHALGVGHPPTVIASKCGSADSSAVSMGPVMGGMVYASGGKVRQVSPRDGRALYEASTALRPWGFPTRTVMQDGKWTAQTRHAVWVAGLLSVSDLWDTLRERNPVAAEGWVGPRYYHSMTTTEGVHAIKEAAAWAP